MHRGVTYVDQHVDSARGCHLPKTRIWVLLFEHCPQSLICTLKNRSRVHSTRESAVELTGCLHKQHSVRTTRVYRWLEIIPPQILKRCNLIKADVSTLDRTWHHQSMQDTRTATRKSIWEPTTATCFPGSESETQINAWTFVTICNSYLPF